MNEDAEPHRTNPSVPPADDAEITFPPSTARLIRVAAGLQAWSEAEAEWIKQNPRWLRYEQRMRETFQAKAKELGSDQAFSKQVDASRKDKPPSI